MIIIYRPFLLFRMSSQENEIPLSGRSLAQLSLEELRQSVAKMDPKCKLEADGSITNFDGSTKKLELFILGLRLGQDEKENDVPIHRSPLERQLIGELLSRDPQNCGDFGVKCAPGFSAKCGLCVPTLETRTTECNIQHSTNNTLGPDQ